MSLSTLTVAFGVSLFYVACSVFYRLWIHPLRHIPGPRLAAATLWYEFYYDVVLRGRYEFEIMRMHEQYGPLVRISPNELHCSDPEFIPTLYSGSGTKRDKYWFMSKQFGISESMFGTLSHDLHRIRRAPLNPFFSKAAVTKLEPVIRKHVSKLCGKLEEYSGSAREICLGMAYGCMTTDIITEYAFTRTYDCLDSPGFGGNFHSAIVGATKLGPLFKQFTWLLPLLQSLPDSWMKRLSPGFASQVTFRNDMKSQIREIMAKGSATKEDEDVSSTIFGQVLDSPKLPDREKSVDRLSQDGSSIIGAGTETTAWTLSAMTLFVLRNNEVLRTLYEELSSCMSDSETLPSVSDLEKLPYLTAVIMESLRLSYGISTRLQRLAADPLDYHPSPLCTCPTELRKSYQIPAGTPVGMSALQIHHNEKLFPESFEFKPTRWLGTSTCDVARLDKYLLSFSKGTRQCIGINLAFAELYLTTAVMIRRFGLRMSLYDTTYEEHVRCEQDAFVPVPKNEDGVRVKISK